MQNCSKSNCKDFDMKEKKFKKSDFIFSAATFWQRFKRQEFTKRNIARFIKKNFSFKLPNLWRQKYPKCKTKSDLTHTAKKVQTQSLKQDNITRKEKKTTTNISSFVCVCVDRSIGFGKSAYLSVKKFKKVGEAYSTRPACPGCPGCPTT